MSTDADLSAVRALAVMCCPLTPPHVDTCHTDHVESSQSRTTITEANP